MTKYVLVRCDGYNIDNWTFEKKQDAIDAMQKQYNDSMPEHNCEDYVSQCSITDNNAILYANGENVYVWSIIPVLCEKLDIRFPVGARYEISGDSDELGLEDYHVSVSSPVHVVEQPTTKAKKVLVCIEEIDGDHNVWARIAKKHLLE